MSPAEETLDRIAQAFASSVARGDFDAAETWLEAAFTVVTLDGAEHG